MRKTKKIIAVILMPVLCLLGCGSDEESRDYSAKIYELTEEETALVTNPSAEYVIAALHQLESVTGIEQDPDVAEGSIDASKANECIARIYFTSSMVDQSGFGEEDSVLEKGTSAGGSIDIYANVEDAVARDEYLHGFDDNWLLNSGSHAIAGTIVIRTSEKLHKDEQIALTDSIVTSLTSGNITKEVIELAMEEMAEEEADRIKELEDNNSVEDVLTETEEISQAVVAEKIRIGTDCEDFIDMRYDEIVPLLKDKGFTNIVENPVVIEFDLYKESKCLEITIDGNKDFSASDKFNQDDEIVITYYTGALASAPDDWTNLLEKHYEDVKKQFENAGFTNITCVAHEIDYNEDNVFDGSVINIAVGPTGSTCTFEKGEQWYTNVEIRIDYRIKTVSTPTPVPAPEPTPAPTSAPTPEPAPAPTQAPNAGSGNSEGGSGVTVPDHEESGANLVWVPTNGGKKYHSKPTCSSMEDPMQVTVETAETNGYTPCGRCY